MRIALYQPDIPQNTGTILRMGACLGIPVDIIAPAGFDLSGPAIKRAGLDYLADATLHRHESWTAFEHWRRTGHAAPPPPSGPPARLVLLTTQASLAYTAFTFSPGDILLFGRESAGVPHDVHNAADARLTIPMVPRMRSLNVAVSAAMVLGEALRQTGGFPEQIAPDNASK